MSDLHPIPRPRSGDRHQPQPSPAVLVMLAEEDDRVVIIDLSTHPCGQHILDDYAASARLVSADHLHLVAPPGTYEAPTAPV